MTSTIRIDSIKPTAKSLVLKSGVWIEKWKRAEPPEPKPAPSAAPSQQQGTFSADGINLAFLPFVSNCVAHAIQAGKVETPHDIQKWAQGAYSAALSLKDVAF